MISANQVKVGTKLLLGNEKQSYTVKGFDGRYAICTKPFNARKTVLYTIIDFEKGIRGTNNLVFNMYDYEEKMGKRWTYSIAACLRHLKKGSIEISYRNRVKLTATDRVKEQ